eukprot:TRINITY_DN56244_c0_g1_i1.p1 TRINITY_DN56244_c0_g1~~TRINITY_DN56244_c0_g1_i1.p1  ORF type:complete len:445 (+),score=48.83 TRINITY_DN56244_c0_g1_i1:132-1337(+)
MECASQTSDVEPIFGCGGSNVSLIHDAELESLNHAMLTTALSRLPLAIQRVLGEVATEHGVTYTEAKKQLRVVMRPPCTSESQQYRSSLFAEVVKFCMEANDCALSQIRVGAMSATRARARGRGRTVGPKNSADTTFSKHAEVASEQPGRDPRSMHLDLEKVNQHSSSTQSGSTVSSLDESSWFGRARRSLSQTVNGRLWGTSSQWSTTTTSGESKQRATTVSFDACWDGISAAAPNKAVAFSCDVHTLAIKKASQRAESMWGRQSRDLLGLKLSSLILPSVGRGVWFHRALRVHQEMVEEQDSTDENRFVTHVVHDLGHLECWDGDAHHFHATVRVIHFPGVVTDGIVDASGACIVLLDLDADDMTKVFRNRGIDGLRSERPHASNFEVGPCDSVSNVGT